MSDKCTDCGLWKEKDGGFLSVVPSDCHDRGGHYVTKFNSDGVFQYTTAPWQVFPNDLDLSQEEMLEAKLD